MTWQKQAIWSGLLMCVVTLQCDFKIKWSRHLSRTNQRSRSTRVKRRELARRTASCKTFGLLWANSPTRPECVSLTTASRAWHYQQWSPFTQKGAIELVLKSVLFLNKRNREVEPTNIDLICSCAYTAASFLMTPTVWEWANIMSFGWAAIICRLPPFIFFSYCETKQPKGVEWRCPR